jgi:hypothetical protein
MNIETVKGKKNKGCRATLIFLSCTLLPKRPDWHLDKARAIGDSREVRYLDPKNDLVFKKVF